MHKSGFAKPSYVLKFTFHCIIGCKTTDILLFKNTGSNELMRDAD